MVRLEKIIGVSEDYNRVYAGDGIAVASVLDFCNKKEYSYHVFDAEGEVVAGLGKNYPNKKPSFLFADLNVFGNGGGTATPENILGDVFTFPVQKVYDFAMRPLVKCYVDGLIEKRDHLFSSSDVCISDRDNIFVADNLEVSLGKFSHEKLVRNQVAVFDQYGAGVRKVDITDAVREHSRGDYPGYNWIARVGTLGDRVFVLTGIFGHNMLEFDMTGDYVGETKEVLGINRNYFELNKSGVYSVSDSHPNRVLHIDWDGKVNVHDLGDRIGRVEGLAIGGDEIYLMEDNKIFTYDYSMRFKSEDVIADLPIDEPFGGDNRSCAGNMVYDDGNLYLSVRGFTVRTSSCDKDGMMCDPEEHGKGGIFKLSI